MYVFELFLRAGLRERERNEFCLSFLRRLFLLKMWHQVGSSSLAALLWIFVFIMNVSALFATLGPCRRRAHIYQNNFIIYFYSSRNVAWSSFSGIMGHFLRLGNFFKNFSNKGTLYPCQERSGSLGSTSRCPASLKQSLNLWMPRSSSLPAFNESRRTSITEAHIERAPETVLPWF